MNSDPFVMSSLRPEAVTITGVPQLNVTARFCLHAFQVETTLGCLAIGLYSIRALA
jgi:hypothetical protein